MGILGANIAFSVTRRTETRDAVGGAVYSSAVVASGVQGRLGNASSGARMALQAQGYSSTRVNQITAQPADLNVRENDTVTITGGLNAGAVYLVVQVKRDNLLPNDPRAHVELVVERVVEAPSTP